MNAVKLGIFAKSALLPGEDPKALKQIVSNLRDHYQPKSALEEDIVQQLASTKHRSLRDCRIESGLLHMYLSEESAQRHVAQAFAEDQKNLGCLTKLPQLEGSHDRKYVKLLEELQQVQAERKERERANADQ